MLKKIFNFMVIIVIISLFFDGFVFFIGNQPHRIYEVTLILILAMLALFDKNFFKNLYCYYKETPFKYLVWFILWLFISSAFLIILGITNFLIYYRIITKLLVPMLIPYIVGMYCIPKFLKYKDLYKLLISISFFIFLFGLICYFGENSGIPIFTKIQDSVSNLHLAIYDSQDMFDSISGKLRLRSIFHEPGVLARFIVCFLPIYYSLLYSKDKIYENLSKNLNFYLKIFLCTLAMICLFLAQSPIMIVFAIIVTLSWLMYKNIKFIVSLLLFFIVIILFFIIFNESFFEIIQESFLNRVFKVLFAFRSLSDVVTADYSLGYRIVGIVNNCILSLKSIILGFGYDNSRFFIEPQLLNSPLPLTPENRANLTYLLVPGTGVATYQSCFSRLLSEAGIIGFAIYYFLLYKSIVVLNNIKFAENYNTYYFHIGLLVCYIWLIIFSIYMTESTTPYITFLLGLASSYCMNSKFYIKVEKNEQ